MNAAHPGDDGRPAIGPGELHLWSLRLDQPHTIRDACAGLLSGDEQDRAARFVFDRDRDRYVVCRAALRRAIGAYLGEDAHAVTFAYGASGKPSLRFPANAGLEFNVSHAAGAAVFAFSRAGAVGVDLESRDREVDCLALAERFFAAEEFAELRALGTEHQRDAFFNGWTRKEAYIKATGEGLTCPLDSFCVTLAPGAPAVMRWALVGRPYHLIAFEAGPRLVSAASLQDAPGSVSFREWSQLDGAWPAAAALRNEVAA